MNIFIKNKWRAIIALAVGWMLLLPNVMLISQAQDDEEEFRRKLEELADDPSLPREERIQRHRQKLALILERRRQKEEEQRRQKEQEEKGSPPAPVPQPPSQPTPSIETYKPAEKVGAIIYLDPLSLQVLEGENFLTQIVYEDYKEQPIDEIYFTIKYDKRYLLPVKVFDYPIHNLLESPPRFNVNPVQGIIEYGGKLTTPRRLASRSPLLLILWKALRQTQSTEVGFKTGVGFTRILSRGVDYLGTDYEENDGVIPATIGIKPKVLTPEKALRNLEPVETSESSSGMLGVGLKLISSRQQVAPEEEFEVDLVLLNPEGVLLDDISALIRFNPAKLEVIDYDKKNWIKRGINIYDGFAHNNYPFDFHKANAVDNEKGTIHYWMGLSQPQALPSGSFAKIKFRVRKDASDSAFIFFDYSPKNDQPTTDARYFGTSLL
ncbi:MAG: hypothetical protein N2246_06025, partial [Candidatus Sumerlaeia bacterium]|nr:hypothetical protein [Candidatus Sumerlaeia bacterium]